MYNAHFVGRGLTGPLHKHSLGHWNNTVEGLAQNVLKMYMEFDIHLYDRSVSPCRSLFTKYSWPNLLLSPQRSPRKD